MSLEPLKEPKTKVTDFVEWRLRLLDSCKVKLMEASEALKAEEERKKSVGGETRMDRDHHSKNNVPQDPSVHK
jgi:hypothetical protein